MCRSGRLYVRRYRRAGYGTGNKGAVMPRGVADVFGSAYVKKRGSGGGRVKENKPLRNLYAAMYKARGMLPSELAHQNPFIFFQMLDDLAAENTAEDMEVKKKFPMFYGL